MTGGTPVASISVAAACRMDDFKRNLFVARAEMRASFGVLVPEALSMVKLNGSVEFPGEE